MATETLLHAIGAVTTRQHGLITKAQLQHHLGISTAAIRRRVRNGLLVKVDHGVYRLAGGPVTWDSHVLACVLAAGPGAVASHRTAAALWELDGCRKGKPEISIPRGHWYRSAEARVHQSNDLDLVHPVKLHGITTTSIERTLLDLCAVTSMQQVELALDHARRRGLTDWDPMLSCLTRHSRQGRNGCGPLRAILDAHFEEVAATDSGFERLVCSLLVTSGLPKPVMQHEVQLDGMIYRLDLAYPERKIAIELDGSIHLRRDVWENDRLRQNALVLDGWTILRFTWRQYVDCGATVVKQVRAALANLV